MSDISLEWVRLILQFAKDVVVPTVWEVCDRIREARPGLPEEQVQALAAAIVAELTGGEATGGTSLEVWNPGGRKRQMKRYKVRMLPPRGEVMPDVEIAADRVDGFLDGATRILRFWREDELAGEAQMEYGGMWWVDDAPAPESEPDTCASRDSVG